MDVAVSVLGRLLLALLARVVEVPAVKHYLRAERAHRLHLDRVGLLGYEDRRAHAEEIGCVSNGLAVVPGGCRRDAAVTLGSPELADQVHAAADLERSDWQVVLVLDPQSCAGKRIQRRVAVQRRRAQVRGDALTRRQDVGQVGDVRCGHVPVLPRALAGRTGYAAGTSRGRAAPVRSREAQRIASAVDKRDGVRGRRPIWLRAALLRERARYHVRRPDNLAVEQLRHRQSSRRRLRQTGTKGPGTR